MPEPYYQQDGITLYVGDNRDVVPHIDPVQAVVTDPPYGLSFMGRDWDHSVPGVPFWQAFRDVMAPGAYLLAFGGSRTFHRMAVAIEDAGFEIRDTLSWLYGSGFPKSLDVSKAIDKAAGAEREIVGVQSLTSGTFNPVKGFGGGPTTANGQREPAKDIDITAPATDAARQWDGWGTALKPAWEPIIMARKPLTGTVASNVLTHGTGALNIDACRIEAQGRPLIESKSDQALNAYGNGLNGSRHAGTTDTGRWPANVILDPDAAAMLDAMSGERRSAGQYTKGSRSQGNKAGPASIPIDGLTSATYGDTGGASRFFYVAKASRSERNAGLDGMPERLTNRYSPKGQGPLPQQTPSTVPVEGNHHPTVKPLALMRWLVRLVTPPNGIILDPFAGSGSTLVAAAHEGISAIGIELNEEYAEIAARRIDHALTERANADAIARPLLLELVAD